MTNELEKLFEEYAEIAIELKDASDHNYWSEYCYKQEDRQKEIISQITQAIQRETILEILALGDVRVRIDDIKNFGKDKGINI